MDEMTKELQKNLMWSMMQDIINSGKWTSTYCLYLIQQFERIYPNFRTEKKGWLEAKEEYIESLRNQEEERLKKILNIDE